MANGETMMFKMDKDRENEARKILFSVYEALKEKGYNPINQLVGYILSGDPTYITNHLNARSVIRRLERDELLEEIVRFYLENKK
ncbi:MAG: IreB family regulatory phosphoprotein [Bacillota bacterium]